MDSKTDPAMARCWFERFCEISERLVRLEPGNPHCLLNLSAGFNKLGRLNQQSDPTKAWGCLQKALEIRAQLAVKDPNNHVHQYNLACSLAQCGDPTAALDSLTSAVILGWNDVDYTADDINFSSLQGMPEFEALLQRMRLQRPLA